MRHIIRWVLVLGGAAVLVGMIAYARGPKHHRGDEAGTHGTRIVIVHSAP